VVFVLANFAVDLTTIGSIRGSASARQMAKRLSSPTASTLAAGPAGR
jgi:hypothetical protein